MDYLNTFITDTESEFKSTAVTMGLTVAGILFVTPMLDPMVATLPGMNLIGADTRRALLAGFYAGVGQFFQGKYFSS